MFHFMRDDNDPQVEAAVLAEKRELVAAYDTYFSYVGQPAEGDESQEAQDYYNALVSYNLALQQVRMLESKKRKP